MNNAASKLASVWSGKYAYLLSFIAIIFLGVFLRASFFSGLVFEDSITIARNSWELYSENALPGEFSQFETDFRLLPNEQNLIVLVTGILYQILGVTDFSSVIFPVVSSLVVGILLFSLGKRWIGKSAGILAMFFWFVLPIGVFLSTTLISALPMIALNTLAVSTYFTANERKSNFLNVVSGALFLAGLIFDWTYFLGSAGFVLYHLSNKLPSKAKQVLGFALIAGATIFMLIPLHGSSAASLYYLVSLVFENLILFPLLIIGLVYAGSVKKGDRPGLILMWLAAKSMFLILGARWISETPDLKIIGMSGYWLDVLVPGVLLLGWVFVNRLNKSIIPATLSILSIAILGIFYAIQSVDSSLATLFTVSRIFFGLSLLFIAVLLAVWNRAERVRFSVFILFLASFLLGSLTITNDYWRSYRYTTDDTQAVLQAFADEGKFSLNVMGDDLFSRFSYTNGFEQVATQFGETKLEVLHLERVDAPAVPAGMYVVLTADYKKFILGSEPENWSLKSEFRNSDQQSLLLYKVNP